MTPTLTDQQSDAVKAVSAWFKTAQTDSHYGAAEHFYLAGYAGTGKSTILPAIIDACGLQASEVAFCAPTGKAAKIMGQKLTDYGMTGADARTIHSQIYLPGKAKADYLERQLDGMIEERNRIIAEGTTPPDMLLRQIEVLDKELEEAYMDHEGPHFLLNMESRIIFKRLIVIDEASMVGSEVASDLKKFGVPILAIGDPGQLPPVADTAGLTAGRPDFFLDQIHRQAKDNPIIWLSKLAREGKNLPLGSHGGGLVRVIRRKDDDVTYDPDRDLQLIVGTNRKRWQITTKLRDTLGYQSSGPCHGEPLIICKNSRDIPHLVNGTFVECGKDVGNLIEGVASIPIKIIEENGEERTILAFQGLLEETQKRQKGVFTAPLKTGYNARKKCEHVDWGWAITCHKSQGSQWDEVCVHDESGTFGEDAHLWLYTAVTRAAKKLTIVIP